MPISGTAQKSIFFGCEGKLCSKFGEDRSRTELTILAVVAGWTDTGRTDGRTDAKVNLYSAQCCTLHWTDKNEAIHNSPAVMLAAASFPSALRVSSIYLQFINTGANDSYRPLRVSSRHAAALTPHRRQH